MLEKDPGSLKVSREQAYKTYKLGGAVSELLYSPAAYGIDLSQKDMPRPRECFTPGRYLRMRVVAAT